MIFVGGCDSVLIIHFLDDRSIGKREKRERERAVQCQSTWLRQLHRKAEVFHTPRWMAGELLMGEPSTNRIMFQPCSNTHGRTTCYNWTLPLLTLLQFTHLRFLGWLLGWLDQLTLVAALKCVRKRYRCGWSTAPPSRIWSRLIAVWPIPGPFASPVGKPTTTKVQLVKSHWKEKRSNQRSTTTPRIVLS